MVDATKISGSSGNVISLKDWLEFEEPELLRFMMISYKPKTVINFDLHSNKFFLLADRYDEAERVFFDKKEKKDARKSKIRENQRFSVSLRNSKNFKEISGTHSVGNDKDYVHTLNCTAIATSRPLRSILENYQQKDGTVKAPAALLPYQTVNTVLGT